MKIPLIDVIEMITVSITEDNGIETIAELKEYLEENQDLYISLKHKEIKLHRSLD